jgi:hypothetical protein
VTFSQSTVSGFVLNTIFEEPLVGFSVFYDGTTIGGVTNDEGYFELTTDKVMTANLVVSYIGYKTQIFEGVKTGHLGNILLSERAIQLDEVVLKPDTWSRKKKLGVFKKAFLGPPESGRQCKILNEQDIRLYYDKDKNTLYAYDASKRVQIENKFLGFRIAYELDDFEAGFKQITSDLNVQSATYFTGSAFFSQLDSEITKAKYLKRRDYLYKGSVLHFMRALSKKSLVEEGFTILKDKLQIEPYDEFDNVNAYDWVEITQKEEMLGILYKDMYASSVRVVQNLFYIDNYGNNSPPKSIKLGGAMASRRIGGMFPLDYGLE